MTDLALSDLVFPEPGAPSSLSGLLGELRRSNLSVAHRLRSIRQDSIFVNQVQECFGRRPLVANERCGGWYVEPGRKGASAYFKSTDGHTNAWKFSTRRLNLHLLDVIEQNDGCIIVDSTRRGKRMPDALSKTVPVWCAVLNRVLFPGVTESHALFTPPNVVPASEHHSIAALLPGFFLAFRALGLSPSNLNAKLTKPLRPIWVTQDSPMPNDGDGNIFDSYYPVVCCTASRRVDGGELAEGGYIQGAGDDTENWAMGLTPDLFWDNIELLLGAANPTLPSLIASLVRRKPPRELASDVSAQVGPGLYVASLPLPTSGPGECCLILAPAVKLEGPVGDSESVRTFGVGKHKLGSRNLRSVLPDVVGFVGAYLRSAASRRNRDYRILVGCESGRDLSVGIALGLLCWFFDENNNLRSDTEKAPSRMNKDIIRAKLASIMIGFPAASVSRSTLQSINSFLMSNSDR